MEPQFIAAAERLSGRRVLRFIPDHHVGRDLEIERFFPVDVPSTRHDR
jgi:hypothetical protein